MSTPYVTFPGTSGDYVSSDDVNLLDADTAHLAQTRGLWTVGALSTDFPLFGATSLKVTGGVDTAITPATDAAMFSVYVYSAAGATFDINGSTGVAVAAATWTQLSETGPDGTYTIGCSTAADYYVGKACVRAGTDPAFVPSLRVVGDLDMRAKVAADYSSLSRSGIIENYNTAGYRLEFFNTTSLLLATTGSDYLIAAHGLSDGDAAEIRGTVDVSTGDFEVFVDGSSVASATKTAGPLNPSADLVVGSWTSTVFLFDGDIYWAEVRDGIDGPVVARFDAVDTAKATL